MLERQLLLDYLPSLSKQIAVDLSKGCFFFFCYIVVGNSVIFSLCKKWQNNSYLKTNSYTPEKAASKVDEDTVF